MAWLLDMHPLMGLLGGTITLVGGHGTGAAYATRFADFNNIQDVMALAMTSATLGASAGRRGRRPGRGMAHAPPQAGRQPGPCRRRQP